jgi:hypothetical protein
VRNFSGIPGFSSDPDGRIFIVYSGKNCLVTMVSQPEKLPLILITFTILLPLFAGCIYVNPLVQAGETNASPDQATALQVCQITCENHIRLLPLGCICPETTTPLPANVTAVSPGN